jgi:tRNA-dihydrouridine synthase B
LQERVDTVMKHLKFSIEWKGDRQGIFEMRRHYTNYFKGIINFKSTRMKLVTTDDYNELTDLLEEISVKFQNQPQIG